MTYIRERSSCRCVQVRTGKLRMLTQQGLPLLSKKRICWHLAIKMSSLFETAITSAKALQSNFPLQMDFNPISATRRSFSDIQCKTEPVQHGGWQHRAFHHLRKYPGIWKKCCTMWASLTFLQTAATNYQAKKKSPSKKESKLWKPSNLTSFNISSWASYHLEQ